MHVLIGLYMLLIPPPLLNAMGGDFQSLISLAISRECQETMCAYNLVNSWNLLRFRVCIISLKRKSNTICLIIL